MGREGLRRRCARQALRLGAAVGVAVTTSTLVGACDGNGGRAEVSALPASYAVTYRVEQNGARHWEVLTVSRPLQGSDLVYDTATAPRPGDVPNGGTIATPTELLVVNTTGVHHASGRQPGPPTGDVVFEPTLPAMLDRHLASDRHATRRVAGRVCHVIRLAEPPSGALPVLDPSGPGHDDICITSSGVVVHEEWTYHGHVVLRRTATRLSAPQTGDKVPAALVRDARPAPTAAATVTPASAPVTSIAEPPVPAGFNAFGSAYEFRLPDPQVPSATATSSIVWVFVDGPRVITVEAGRTRGGQLPWRNGDTATSPVSLRGLGRALVGIRSDGGEVRVDLGDRGWVRVRGTVALDRLVRYAGELLPSKAG